MRAAPDNGSNQDAHRPIRRFAIYSAYCINSPDDGGGVARGHAVLSAADLRALTALASVPACFVQAKCSTDMMHSI